MLFTSARGFLKRFSFTGLVQPAAVLRRPEELCRQARVLLARLLATRARLLVADEPAAGLDPAAQLLALDLLRRTIRYEEDLVDHLCNTSEQRLARSLLLLAHVGREGRTEAVGTKVNQETLAQMVGTTRSRVSHFMNKFRERGLVDYNGRGELMVTNKLLDVANNFSNFPSDPMAA